MSPIKLYYVPGSAPCRAVLLTASALNIDLDLKFTNLMKGEHMSLDFLKINPLHCVPTIDDNGFILWESRAIMQYLANKYAKADCLYPKDPQKRAVVDQWLNFDLGTLYASLSNYYYPKIFAGAPHDEANFKKVQTAFESLDKMLAKSKYIAGDRLTLADLSLVATVSTVEALDFDLSSYRNVSAWYETVKSSAPGYDEANAQNVLKFKQLVNELASARK